MKKFQKGCLILTIFFCLNYAFHILLDFNIIDTFLESHVWMDKVYAFLLGVCGFSDILLLKKDDTPN